MLILDQPMYRKLGFSWGAKHGCQQRSWLQFADDAAIVAADNASAQGLLNVFQFSRLGVHGHMYKARQMRSLWHAKAQRQKLHKQRGFVQTMQKPISS